MTKDDIRNHAFSMPLNNPAYPRPPFRFVDREYFIISYETDIEAIREVGFISHDVHRYRPGAKS